MKTILVLAWCGLVAMAAAQDDAQAPQIENPNVVSAAAANANLSRLASFQKPTNPPCCPHGAPYTCPYTTSTLQFFSFSNPNKYCKVIPCHNETINVVSCSCETCKYGTTPGLCRAGYCTQWAMLWCFNFDLWQVEPPKWHQIKVPCYCYCQSIIPVDVEAA